MATLEEYVAQATNAYKPAQTAIQNQLGALDSQYNTELAKLNRNYEQQEKALNTQRNQAAEDASLAAAARGSGFGGQAELANQKYYERTFTPALASLQSNKSNSIDSLRQNIENQRTSLNSQMANLEAQANQQALQQYWAQQEAERQRQAQLAANTAQQRITDAIKNRGGQGGGLKNWDFGNGYSVQQLSNGQASYRKNGNVISAAEFMAGANHDWNKWNDIWNNGVKTQGVGSDTVNLFNRMSNNPYLSSMMTQDKSLSYLNNIRY